MEKKKLYTENQYEVTYQVDSQHKGQRIDQFIKDFYPTMSREYIKKKIEIGEIEILARPHKLRPSTKVQFNDEIKITIKRSHLEDEYWRGEKLELIEKPTILFEDDHLLIISKPPFMTTHPAGKHLFYCATVCFEKIHQKTIHSTHRIDRETSGILILGKDSETSSDISYSFYKNKVYKAYFFIALKQPNATNFPFEANEELDRDPNSTTRLFMKAFPQGTRQGKPSLTRFELLFEYNQYILALAFPFTGRQHQIRAHAFHHGYPLLGDKLYHHDPYLFGRFKDGKAQETDYEFMQIPRQALHAIGLSFPYRHKRKVIIDTIPNDLEQFIRKNTSISIKDLNQKIKDKVEHYFNERK